MQLSKKIHILCWTSQMDIPIEEDKESEQATVEIG